MKDVRATMGEGKTPLIPSACLGPDAGYPRLFFKLENCNPSGSYKDRFIAAEVTGILQTGRRVCVGTSSGNTGSALAAYAARYGIRCVIFVNERTPAGKLTQMRSYGARIVRVRGFGEDAAITEAICSDLERLSQERSVPLVISAFRYCPDGMLGVSSISQELLEQQAKPAIDHVFVPVGGGGLFSAVAEGFLSLRARPPAIHAVQPEGCSTVAASFLAGRDTIEPVASSTRISGLSVPFDIDGTLALQYLKRCGGTGLTVSDEEVFTAQSHLLQREGIYCEPAGAAALAGFRKAAERGLIGREQVSVCLVSGHGSKDPDAIERVASGNRERLIDARDLAGEFRHLAAS